jgi:hypothetical protein
MAFWPLDSIEAPGNFPLMESEPVMNRVYVTRDPSAAS